MMTNTVSIGFMIEAEMKRQGRSASWLAEQLCCHRTNIYNIYKRDNIDIALLKRISDILSHDFFKDLSTTIYSRNIGGGGKITSRQLSKIILHRNYRFIITNCDI